MMAAKATETLWFCGDCTKALTVAGFDYRTVPTDDRRETVRAAVRAMRARKSVATGELVGSHWGSQSCDCCAQGPSGERFEFRVKGLPEHVRARRTVFGWDKA